MAKRGTPYDIPTYVKLSAPKEVGVTLVPYQEVKEAEFLFLWATIFLGIFTAVFGALISLALTDYSNTAVIWLLTVAVVLLLVGFGTFAILGYRKRVQLRLEAMHSGEASSEDFKSAIEM